MIIANDEMAIGAHQAATDLGLRAQLTITGFDAIDSVLLALEDGAIDATISQGSEEQARLASRTLFESLINEIEPEKKTTILPDFDVQTSDFDVQTSDFDVQTSDFDVQTSDFDVQTAE